MADVFEYDDYRAYVRDWLAARKGRTQGGLAAAVGLSPPALSMTLNAASTSPRRLASTRIAPLADALGLEGQPRAYFRALVEAKDGPDEHARDEARRRAEAIRTFQDGAALRRSKFALISTWVHMAVFELVQIPGVPAEPASIARALMPPITEQEAAESLSLLEALGLLTVGPDGFARVRHSVIIDPEFRSEAERSEVVGTLHRETLRRAEEAISTIPSSERYLGTIMVGLSTAQAEEARALLRQTLQQIIAMGEEAATKDRVHQVMIQLWPVSRGRLTPQEESPTR